MCRKCAISLTMVFSFSHGFTPASSPASTEGFFSMPSLSRAPVRHSSLPPSSPPSHRHSSLLGSSPPASRQTSLTRDDSPVTPRQHTLLFSSRSVQSSGPPPYSAAVKTPKPASGRSRPSSATHSAIKAPKSGIRARHSSARQHVSDMAGSEQARAQLEGEDVHFAIIDNKLTWKRVTRVSKYRIKELLMSTLPAVKRQKREVYSKDWLLAQLFHYDLFNTYNQYRHDTQSTEKTLTNMLLMAIENGLVCR